MSRPKLNQLIGIFLLAVSPVSGQTSKQQPVNRCQLTAWIAGRISDQRIGRLLGERGVAFLLSPSTEKQLQAEGTSAQVLKAIKSARVVKNVRTSECPASLAKVAELVRDEKFDAAQSV